MALCAFFQGNRNQAPLPLAEFLAGNWTLEGEQLSPKLLFQIVQLNGTRLEPVSLGDFTSWLSSAFSFFKEWVGVAMFGAALLCGMVFRLWLICRIRRQHRQDNIKIIQALRALDQGASPQVWLVGLRDG
ncbi:1500011B03Rik [Phodopus roborovskii]|uniref:1500011B03Rik protein n=1 Tax=Phodopus roborovskii TaxID=109678 RepID=A0AAU9YQY8_PHORO|nr:1500011B03Rik [Phodopus roborovskii]